ncbi:MAG: alpha/beta fold hydrolase [Candidatus Eremiobacteraeota bacterium]|nr:alpha/beta fold hydrolase [Candidatus Eremiobacteraeota bacterium]MBV8365696.1 alpha/beta fold hydrolase [Candidatus Eremiobacteraeota bacterium]
MARAPLVLLHAWPLDHRMWDSQVQTLAGLGTVMAPDLPGFGKEPMTARPSLDDWAKKLSARLRSDGVDKAVVAGCSMGGYTALALLRVDPSLLAGIALVDSRLTADTPIVAAARGGTIGQIERTGTAFLVENTTLSLGPTARKNPDVIERVRTMVSDGNSAGLIAAYRAIGSRPDMSAAVSASDVPLAIIAGTDDVVVPIAEMRELAGAIPRARLTEVPGAGHFSPLESPEVVSDALRSFWESVG